ncbi:virion core protein, T7 gp14 family [Variovorax sp. GT1P44]|uniref:virion core protein, T7 gp14 family n=1 Tax=Variovorax sp. GT1P44 TaxID=3443742 RepID=UPI003F48E5CC
MGIEVGGLSAGGLTSAFGAGMSAVGAYGQAKSQQAALQAQAQVAENNETLATWQSEDAVTRGQIAASNALQKGAQVKSSQRAAMAANNVDLSVGSPQAVLDSTDYITATDAATLENNALREAWGYRQQARQYADSARASRAGASQINPWLSAGTSLLTSATSVASRWYQGSGSAGGGRVADGYSRSVYSGNRGIAD